MIAWGMMPNGAPTLIHGLVPPSVYLDHWALLTFSQDAGLSRRFTGALAARGGTLTLSWVNVAEFSKVGNEEAARGAEEFVEANVPRLFFLEVNPFIVLERRSAPLPHADFQMAGAFAHLMPDSPKPFTARGLLAVMKGQALDSLDRWSKIFVERVEALRAEYADNANFERQVERSLREGGRETAILVLVRELMRALIRDRKTLIEPNDAQDFFHTVIPVLHCDWVFLDKYWEEQVEHVRARLQRAGVSIPMARVFSKKANGIEQFLEVLEGTPTR